MNSELFPLYVILYIAIMGVCLFFTIDAFGMNDKLLILGIGGSTIILYVLLVLVIPAHIPANYATDFLGASFPVELLLCATPSIIILGIAGMIDAIKWKMKEKRRGK